MARKNNVIKEFSRTTEHMSPVLLIAAVLIFGGLAASMSTTGAAFATTVVEEEEKEDFEEEAPPTVVTEEEVAVVSEEPVTAEELMLKDEEELFPFPVEEEVSVQECDPHYPTVCIDLFPPDLNCADIPYRNFEVLPGDPHRFDGDKDGIGCEAPGAIVNALPADVAEAVEGNDTVIIVVDDEQTDVAEAIEGVEEGTDAVIVIIPDEEEEVVVDEEVSAIVGTVGPGNAIFVIEQIVHPSELTAECLAQINAAGISIVHGALIEAVEEDEALQEVFNETVSEIVEEVEAELPANITEQVEAEGLELIEVVDGLGVSNETMEAIEEVVVGNGENVTTIEENGEQLVETVVNETVEAELVEAIVNETGVMEEVAEVIADAVVDVIVNGTDPEEAAIVMEEEIEGLLVPIEEEDLGEVTILPVDIIEAGEQVNATEIAESIVEDIEENGGESVQEAIIEATVKHIEAQEEEAEATGDQSVLERLQAMKIELGNIIVMIGG